MDIDRLRVLVVLPTNVIGGLETQVYLLLQGLARYRPALLTNRAIHDYFAPLGISIHDFDDYNCVDMQRRINASNFLRGSRAIKRVCALERSDVVLGMGDIGLLFAVLSRDLFRMRAKVIGVIPVTLSGYFRMIGRSPLLAERLLLNYMLTRASRVVVPSNGVKQDLVENYSVREASVRVIYNGFDLDAICRLARDDIPEKKDCAWLVTACRLTEQKDFATLLQAFKIVRKQMNAKLIIVGDGHLRGWIDTMGRPEY